MLHLFVFKHHPARNRFALGGNALVLRERFSPQPRPGSWCWSAFRPISCPSFRPTVTVASII
ncbi:hypothetical protein D7027_19565 [Ochrobactrum intermedium]|nr:hypothetical protein [Brucella intermedia]